jgi:hypothetical protein
MYRAGTLTGGSIKKRVKSIGKVPAPVLLSLAPIRKNAKYRKSTEPVKNPLDLPDRNHEISSLLAYQSKTRGPPRG